ncbi:SIR2 family protein [Pectobacterium brasiliense]|uniref:SIR2 family protein n=1 Tax=Pectobacterium brasiliense TaxID=180957 RepID=UPI0032ED0D3B
MAETTEKIDVTDIYEQEINFLVGSGASSGIFPTLATAMKNETTGWETVETLAQYFEEENKQELKTLLFMYYYKECIEPVMSFNWESEKVSDKLIDGKKTKVIDNYKAFISTLYGILELRKAHEKSINIFTTNYDTCFVEAYEELIKEEKIPLNLNDGTRGFKIKLLEARHFDSIEVKKGVFDSGEQRVPQLNIVHLHGSVYWRKNEESIHVQYYGYNTDRIIKDIVPELEFFKSIIENPESNRASFNNIILSDGFFEISTSFWNKYNSLPIVNPTKWKFHETVFEEHYYQMLRHMSYVLERKNSVLIVFGFSFADEHIRNLIKRSLGNRTLTMFICCYSDHGYQEISPLFEGYINVKFIKLNEKMDFTKFNSDVFSIPSYNKN